MRGLRRLQHRRAFRSLVWAPLAFAAVQVGLSLLLETGQRGLCDADYRVKEERLRARLRDTPDCPLVIVLGSSRTKMGLRAGLLCGGRKDSRPLVFNFGLSASGPVRELLCFHRLLDQGIRPDLLFVEVLPPALTQEGDFPFEGHWLRGERMQTEEIAWARKYTVQPGDLLRQWCTARSCPCVASRSELRHLLRIDTPVQARVNNQHLPGVDGYGWEFEFQTVSPEERAAYTELTHGQYDTALAESHLARPATRAVTDLLALCRAKGIPAALVLMPEESGFRAVYSSGLRISLDGFLRKLQARWHVPLIDARTWIEDKYFWDGHHLLPEGARIFTMRFAQEALEPLLRKWRPPAGQGARLLATRASRLHHGEHGPLSPNPVQED